MVLKRNHFCLDDQWRAGHSLKRPTWPRMSWHWGYNWRAADRQFDPAISGLPFRHRRAHMASGLRGNKTTFVLVVPLPEDGAS